MNILEALQAVKAGKCIVWNNPKNKYEKWYVFQTILLPIGRKQLVYLDADDPMVYQYMPMLYDLQPRAFSAVCMDGIVHEDFVEISLDEMLKEIQCRWLSREENQKKPS